MEKEKIINLLKNNINLTTSKYLNIYTDNLYIIEFIYIKGKEHKCKYINIKESHGNFSIYNNEKSSVWQSLLINKKIFLVIDLIDFDYNKINLPLIAESSYDNFLREKEKSKKFAPNYFSENNLLILKNNNERKDYFDKLMSFQQKENKMANLMPDLSYVSRHLNDVDLNVDKLSHNNQAIQKINDNRFINQLIYIQNKEDYQFKYDEYNLVVTKDNKFKLINQADINYQEYKFIMPFNYSLINYYYTDKGYMISLYVDCEDTSFDLDKINQQLKSQSPSKEQGNIIFQLKNWKNIYINNGNNRSRSTANNEENYLYSVLIKDKFNNIHLQLINLKNYYDEKFKKICNVEYFKLINQKNIQSISATFLYNESDIYNNAYAEIKMTGKDTKLPIANFIINNKGNRTQSFTSKNTLMKTFDIFNEHMQIYQYYIDSQQIANNDDVKLEINLKQ